MVLLILKLTHGFQLDIRQLENKTPTLIILWLRLSIGYESNTKDILIFSKFNFCLEKNDIKFFK